MNDSRNGIQLESARHIWMTIKCIILYWEHNKKTERKNGSETEDIPKDSGRIPEFGSGLKHRRAGITIKGTCGVDRVTGI